MSPSSSDPRRGTPIPWELLDRYLSGEATAAEAADAERYFDGQADARAQLARFVDRLDDVDAATPDFRAGLRALEHAIGHDDVGAEQSIASTQTSRITRGTIRRHAPSLRHIIARWRVATAVLLVVGVGLASVTAGVTWYRAARNTTSSFATNAPLRTYATAAGQFAVVTLDDRSQITLAPRSSLVLSAGFGTRDREMTLTGEAHFAVVPDPTRPFTVRTAGVTTRVLGTTFDIRRYAGDRVGRVVVWSGKVATGARNASMLLTAGMAGQFSDSAILGSVANDSTMYTDWANGQLVFRNAPVLTVLATLQQWYGYSFQLSDSTLRARHVSAVFTAGDTPEMLDVVAHVLRVHVTRQDSLIILRPDPTATVPSRDSRAHPHHFSFPAEVGR